MKHEYDTRADNREPAVHGCPVAKQKEKEKKLMNHEYDTRSGIMNLLYTAAQELNKDHN